jgi:Helicase conserved C-terminal domain
VLTEREIKTWLFTGGQTSEELNSALSGFRREQGILIGTAVALTGIDLRDVQTLIHYDPTSESEVPFRISRNPTATHYLLKDTSGVLPVEWTVSNHLKTVPRK